MKITSGNVMTPVPLQLSRRSLAFYHGKVPGFMYSLLREYKPTVILTFFSLFEQPSSKIKYSVIKIRLKIIISLSFVQKI